jgi:hypothetical protein
MVAIPLRKTSDLANNKIGHQQAFFSTPIRYDQTWVAPSATSSMSVSITLGEGSSTDLGQLQYTKNGGGAWATLTPNIRLASKEGAIFTIPGPFTADDAINLRHTAGSEREIVHCTVHLLHDPIFGGNLQHSSQFGPYGVAS